jgi:prepilin-type N-terminal cleavage/methylation domain-containing protein
MRRSSRDGGFTLVELLVAMVLLATVLTVAAGAISAATRAQAAASRRTTEARLAETKLAEIQALGTTSGADEGTFAELEQAQTSEAGDWSDYHYRWEVATGDVEGLARAQVSVWYQDDDRNPYTLIWYRVSP